MVKRIIRKSNTLASHSFKDFKGSQPAADGVSPKLRRYVEDEMAPNYMKFLDAMIAPDVVGKVKSMADEAGFVIGRPDDRPFFVTDEDMGINGAVSNSGAMVIPGNPNYPVRIMFTHSDSPCLLLRVNPAWTEIDAELEKITPSLYFLTSPYGGIRKEEWYGKDVRVLGRIFDIAKGHRRIEGNGTIENLSVHVEKDNNPKEFHDPQGRTYSNLLIKTGARSLKELFRMYGVRDESEFQNGEIFAVPFHSKPVTVGNDITAYGQDDSSCGWASADVMAEMTSKKRRNGNTVIAFYLDKEEVGGKDTSSGYRGFTESVIKHTLRRVLGGRGYGELDMPLDLSTNRLMKGLPAMVLDVDVGLGNLERNIHRTGDGVDIYNAGLPGWGCFISREHGDWDFAEASPRHIARLKHVMDEGFGVSSRERYQVIGGVATNDMGIGKGTAGNVFYSYMPVAGMGVPLVGLHGLEQLNMYDQLRLRQAIKFYAGCQIDFTK